MLLMESFRSSLKGEWTIHVWSWRTLNVITFDESPCDLTRDNRKVFDVLTAPNATAQEMLLTPSNTILKPSLSLQLSLSRSPQKVRYLMASFTTRFYLGNRHSIRIFIDFFMYSNILIYIYEFFAFISVFLFIKYRSVGVD